MTHEEKINNWWKTHKYINRVDALNRLGIYNLTATISRMRKKGYKIESMPQKKGKNYVKYYKEAD